MRVVAPALAMLVVVATSSCGPRNGFLEITLPFDPGAEGLNAQVRIVHEDGSPGTVSAPRLVDATRVSHLYSVEVRTEPFAMVLEVCLCDAGSACFLDDGTCRGIGMPRGGLYRFDHTRTGFIGQRTRWTANTCPMAATPCPLTDPVGARVDVPVDRCSVEGCCPLCMPGRYCTDPAMEIHRCE